MSSPTRVYMDVDPGIDDALAMAAALGCVDLQGVSTVAGNVPLDHTFSNALQILRRAGRLHDISVVRGSSEPLFAPLATADHIHGSDGLAGYGQPESVSNPISKVPGWVWLGDQLADSATPAALIATGPLTNIARLMMGLPHCASHYQTLAIMGGARRQGNTSPTAEFNFYTAPDAADWVLGHAHHVRLVGLEVCRQTRVPVDALNPLAKMGPFGQFLWQLLTPYAMAMGRRSPNPTLVLYDVLAVAALAQPDLFVWGEESLAVVREGQWRGTVIAIPQSDNRPAIAVAESVDVPRFYEWFWQAVHQSTSLAARNG